MIATLARAKWLALASRFGRPHQALEENERGVGLNLLPSGNASGIEGFSGPTRSHRCVSACGMVRCLRYPIQPMLFV